MTNMLARANSEEDVNEVFTEFWVQMKLGKK